MKRNTDSNSYHSGYCRLLIQIKGGQRHHHDTEALHEERFFHQANQAPLVEIPVTQTAAAAA
jgi:hypothetical protein